MPEHDGVPEHGTVPSPDEPAENDPGVPLGHQQAAREAWSETPPLSLLRAGVLRAAVGFQESVLVQKHERLLGRPLMNASGQGVCP